MDKDRQLLDEKSSDFDSVMTTPAIEPPTQMLSKKEAEIRNSAAKNGSTKDSDPTM